MTAELDLARAIADAVDVKVANMRPESSTMPAIYQGTDAEGKGWVLLPGATEPTPVSRMAVEAAQGDTVSVTVANGKATVDSNVSNPSAGIAGVKVVERTANTASATANEALTAAADARGAANSAQASADTARQAATDATLDAATARSMAESATADAATASASAAIAKESADKATYALSDVENVVGTLNWIAEHGEYVLTSDTDIVDGKAYYTRSGTAPDYVYTVVASPDASELSTYYELELDESVQNYIASHIYLMNDGLYVTTDSNDYKVRIDGDSVDVIDDSGHVVASFGTSVTVGEDTKSHVTIESDSVSVSNEIGGELLDVDVARTSYGSLTGPSLLAKYTSGNGNQLPVLWVMNAMNNAGTAFIDKVNLLFDYVNDFSFVDGDSNYILGASKNGNAYDWYVKSSANFRSAIEALPSVSVDHSGEDMNDQSVGGVWWGNNMGNSPDGTTAYFMAFRIGSLQIAYKHVTNGGEIYVWARNYINSTWGAWTQLDNRLAENTTISDICTAGTNISITSASYVRRGGIASFEVKFKPTAAISSGTTVFTITSGKRPAIDTNGVDTSTTYSCLLHTNGTVTCQRSLTSGTTYTFRTTYILA